MPRREMPARRPRARPPAVHHWRQRRQKANRGPASSLSTSPEQRGHRAGSMCLVSAQPGPNRGCACIFVAPVVQSKVDLTNRVGSPLDETDALMLSNFLIGLREGLEASLVVGILVAYLVKSGYRDRLPAVWAGVGAAVVASLAVGFGLSITSHSLSFKANEGFGGTMSLVAVVFVTGMIFWMRRQSHRMKAQIPPSSWYGTVLKGVFNFSPDATWLQVVAYCAYLIPAMILFFRPVRRSAAAAAPASQPARSSVLASR